MNLSDMRFPRKLEADGLAESVRRALKARTVKLWPGGQIDAALIAMSDPLRDALRAASLKGRIRFGFEAIVERLEGERKGIANVRERTGVLQGDRVSRLLLFSSDGAERFYRHVENLLLAHVPRLLGCLLDIDGSALGHMIAGGDRVIKIVMVEHKDDVSTVLRAIAPGQDSR